MPIADPERYRAMIDGGADGGYAYPAINVSSSSTLNAALRGFAEAGSDGIVQVSTGAGTFASGPAADMAVGARALALHAHGVAGEPPDRRRAPHRPLPAVASRPVRAPAPGGDPRAPLARRAAPLRDATCSTAPACRSGRTSRWPLRSWRSAPGST